MITIARDIHNKIVTIEEVRNGKNCKCFCPKCKEELIAKNQGKIKAHHFAHANSESTCTFDNENLITQKNEDIFSTNT